jgi:hypothetical protein
MPTRTGLLALFAAAVLLAGDHPGIPPRAPTDYAAQQTVPGVTIAGSVVPPEQLKKIFSKDLAHAGYIVLEVAVYPDAGATADFGTAEFTLRVGSDPTILPSLAPGTVAAGEKPTTVSKSKVPQLPGNVHVYTTETIGYESGGYGRRGGVYTGTSTTVGVGNPGSGPVYYPDPRGCDPNDASNRNGRGCQPMPMPGPDPGQKRPPKDRAGLQKELEDKALPEGRTSQPVAGYLYFQRPSTKEKNPTYQLTWYRVGGDVQLRVPAPK